MAEHDRGLPQRVDGALDHGRIGEQRTPVQLGHGNLGPDRPQLLRHVGEVLRTVI
ncbi:hypothetical protein [Streptomyces sp. TE12347]